MTAQEIKNKQPKQPAREMKENMKKVFVITWDTEYEGLLYEYKAYSSLEKAKQAVENYINKFNPEKQALMRNGSLTIPQIHELVLCD